MASTTDGSSLSVRNSFAPSIQSAPPQSPEFRAGSELRRPDLSYAERMKRVKRYQKSKVSLRAMTIARTELAFSSAAGQRGLWEKAAKDGLIKLNMMKKKWLATFDKRQCAICKTLGNSPPIAYEKTWPVGINTYKDAPAHPNCRCRTSLVRAK